jgi:hypothetical protein
MGVHSQPRPLWRAVRRADTMPTMPTSATRIRLSAAPRRAVPAVGIIAITA